MFYGCSAKLLLAWIDGTAVVLGVGQDEVARARKDTDEEWYNSTVQFSDENGGGTMATLEMFHQLHCLVCDSTSHTKSSPLIHGRT